MDHDARQRGARRPRRQHPGVRGLVGLAGPPRHVSPRPREAAGRAPIRGVDSNDQRSSGPPARSRHRLLLRIRGLVFSGCAPGLSARGDLRPAPGRRRERPAGVRKLLLEELCGARNLRRKRRRAAHHRNRAGRIPHGSPPARLRGRAIHLRHERRHERPSDSGPGAPDRPQRALRLQGSRGRSLRQPEGDQRRGTAPHANRYCVPRSPGILPVLARLRPGRGRWPRDRDRRDPAHRFRSGGGGSLGHFHADAGFAWAIVLGSLGPPGGRRHRPAAPGDALRNRTRGWGRRRVRDHGNGPRSSSGRFSLRAAKRHRRGPPRHKPPARRRRRAAGGNRGGHHHGQRQPDKRRGRFQRAHQRDRRLRR